MSIGVGLVGFGLSGRVFHAPLLKAAGLTLVAVSSSESEKVHAAYSDLHVHSTAAELFDDPNVELAIIASPSSTHAELAIAALNAGKHVVVDKPFASTVAEADEIIKTAEYTAKIVTCFQNRRWDSDFLTIQKLLRSGDLGDISSYRAHFEYFKPDIVQKWQERPAPGVGIHYDLGTHLVDQALYLFGVPDWVEGDVLVQRTNGQIPDAFHARMAKNSMRIDLFASYYCADFSSRYAIHGSQGSYKKSHMDIQEQQLRSGLTPLHKGFGIEPKASWATVTRYKDGVMTKKSEPSVPGCHHQFYSELRHAIETNSPPPVLATEARETIRVIESIVQSSQSGSRVVLDGG